MLTISLISFILAVPLFAHKITATVFTRIIAIVLFYSAILTWNSLYYLPLSQGGVGLYSGLFHVSTTTLAFQILVCVVGAILLAGWGPTTSSLKLGNSKVGIERSVSINTNFVHVNTINEYSMIVLFSVLGSVLLISSYNFLSMYMGIELQSFAAYILCSLYRNSQSATFAGLKYFLLGSLASGIIVLGTAIIYAGTGITGFDDLATLISVGDISSANTYVTLSIAGGLLLIGIGYIFKVGAAPLYNWAPDVYDGVPTIITSWVSTMPKIGILVFLLNLSFIVTGYDLSWNTEFLQGSDLFTSYAKPFQTLLLVSSVLSFIVGSIVGLSQVRIKRLLTFSTINHVGFLLLALAVSTEESVEGFVFYLVQYSLTNVNTFLTILAFGYITKGILQNNSSVREFVLLDDLKGQFYKNPLLVISFSVSLFSMAGIPPLMGFFAKQMVLYSVSYNYSYVAILAIVMSVISASYYLKIVQLMFFQKDSVPTTLSSEGETSETGTPLITSMHSSVIAILTLMISLYLFDSSILLNACHLLSLSLFSS